MAKLVVLSEGYTGKTYELKTDKTTIGRLDDNSFHVPEGSISSHHCEITLRGKAVHVKDLDSTNGTFINGEKISEKELKPGQVLRLGSLEIRLEVGDRPADSKPADQTVALPQGGVKLGELEQGTQTVEFGKENPFGKKTNKVNMIFIGVGAVLLLAIVVFFAFALFKLWNKKQGAHLPSPPPISLVA